MMKRILTGGGSTNKDVIKYISYYLFKGQECKDFKSYDEYDATAIAYTAIHSDRFIVGIERRMVG